MDEAHQLLGKNKAKKDSIHPQNTKATPFMWISNSLHLSSAELKLFNKNERFLEIASTGEIGELISEQYAKMIALHNDEENEGLNADDVKKNRSCIHI